MYGSKWPDSNKLLFAGGRRACLVVTHKHRIPTVLLPGEAGGNKPTIEEMSTVILSWRHLGCFTSGSRLIQFSLVMIFISNRTSKGGTIFTFIFFFVMKISVSCLPLLSP